MSRKDDYRGIGVDHGQGAIVGNKRERYGVGLSIVWMPSPYLVNMGLTSTPNYRKSETVTAREAIASKKKHYW